MRSCAVPFGYLIAAAAYEAVRCIPIPSSTSPGKASSDCLSPLCVFVPCRLSTALALTRGNSCKRMEESTMAFTDNSLMDLRIREDSNGSIRACRARFVTGGRSLRRRTRARKAVSHMQRAHPWILYESLYSGVEITICTITPQSRLCFALEPKRRLAKGMGWRNRQTHYLDAEKYLPVTGSWFAVRAI